MCMLCAGSLPPCLLPLFLPDRRTARDGMNAHALRRQLPPCLLPLLLPDRRTARDGTNAHALRRLSGSLVNRGNA